MHVKIQGTIQGEQ